MMQQALEQAHLVEGRTSPRPPVGAVVVREGVIVGKGATAPPYGPHAEVNALREAGSAAQGADLYVTLEPCCVTIHTPPCTEAIIRSGIRRVIVATGDPNPRVSGRGLVQLREAGIEVVTGVGEEEARHILAPFATFITQDRPYVTAKWAMTLDGKLASRTGDAHWISNALSRIWVHNLRDRVDAIMVGAGTARIDNPRLTVRLMEQERAYARADRQEPLRVIVAASGELPGTLALLQPDLAERTCVLVGENCPSDRIQALRQRGLDVVPVGVDADGRVDYPQALQVLAAKGLMHILLEGGAQLLGSAFDHALVDAVAVFVAPKIIGGAAAPAPVLGTGLEVMREAHQLQAVRVSRFDDDLLIEGELQK